MKKLTLLLVFCFITSSTLFAQSLSDRATISDTFGFGPKLGYYQAVDADEGNFFGGVQMRLRPGAYFGIEGSVEYRGGQTYGIADYTVKTSFLPVTGSMLFFLPVSKNFAPYAVAGIGAYYTRYNYSDSAEALGFSDTSDFNLGYHFGAGIELPISETLAFNADYRYLFLNPSTNEESFEGADFNSNIISAGLTFYF